MNSLNINLHKQQLNVLNHPAKVKVICSGRGFGKALSLDTPILTLEGWKFISEIREGDYVFHPSGVPTLVVATSEVMYDHQVYEVSFSDGASIKADAGHLWLTHTKSNRKSASRYKNPSLPKVKTTQEIKDTLTVSTKKESNHSIPNCDALQFPGQSLPIDPYVLGCWLGDGDSKNSAYTCDDLEIVESIRVYYEVTKYNAPFRYWIKGLTSELRSLNLLGNKHIPDLYLFASEEQRLKLLRGLMDTDGSIGKNGACEFCNKNLALSEAVVFLLRSLGQKPTLHENTSALYGKDCGFRYRVHFTPTPGFNPFQLARKADRLIQNPYTFTTQRYITSVEAIPSEPVKCIQVESSDGLFLAGEALIPTHNSRLLRADAIKAIFTFKGIFDPESPQEVCLIAPTLKMCRALHWDSLLTLFENCPLVKRIDRTNYRFYFHGNLPILSLVGVDDGGERLRGKNLVWAGCEEFQLFGSSVWDEIITPCFRDPSGCFGGMSVGTPKGKSSFFYQFHLRALSTPDWVYFHFKSEDNPFHPKSLREQAKLILPPKTYLQEYEASWETFSGQLYTEFDDRHIVDTLPDSFDSVWMGLDHGEVNPSLTVIGLKDSRYYLIDAWYNKTQAPITQEEVNQAVLKLCVKHNVYRVYSPDDRPSVVVALRRLGEAQNVPGLKRAVTSPRNKPGVLEGIAIINSLFYQDRLFVHRSLEQVIQNIRSYHKAQDREGNILEKVAENQSDHDLDSFRCVIPQIEIKHNFPGVHLQAA
ncbi:hypothetical protein LEP3755_34060 [Leptolyngbya sp. NIES-3755]|nr:hypothetical protein LEP3755_34060 [Leptolyngbya sp. NIES-3755]